MPTFASRQDWRICWRAARILNCPGGGSHFGRLPVQLASMTCPGLLQRAEDLLDARTRGESLGSLRLDWIAARRRQARAEAMREACCLALIRWAERAHLEPARVAAGLEGGAA